MSFVFVVMHVVVAAHDRGTLGHDFTVVRDAQCDVTPTMTRGAPMGSGFVGVLQVEQSVVDLAQCDRQRLLLKVGFDERADVFEQAFAQLGVVRIDLTGATGRVDDQLRGTRSPWGLRSVPSDWP